MQMVSLKDLSEFLIFLKIKILFTLLPRKLGLFMGRILGLFFYLLDKRHRLVAVANLNMAFGSEFSSSELKRVARSSFMHFGGLLADIIKLSRLREEKKKKLFIIEGEENLLNALSKGKGALLFSGHYGNWEIAPFILSKKGNLNVVARPLDNKLLENELLKIRKSLGAKVIYKQQATKQILHSIRTNEMIALLIDQNVLRSQAVFVDFFGKKAATTPSLAAFFLRTRAPLIPVFCYPTSSHTYHLKIFNPLKITLRGDYSQDVLQITQICTKIIEAQIRKNPKYWLWFHNRWKTRPEKE